MEKPVKLRSVVVIIIGWIRGEAMPSLISTRSLKKTETYVSKRRRFSLCALQFILGVLLSFGSALSSSGQAFYGTMGLVPQRSSGMLLGVVRLFASISAAGTFFSSLGMYAADIFAWFRYLILPTQDNRRARLLQWVGYIKKAEEYGIDVKNETERCLTFIRYHLHRDRHAYFISLLLERRCGEATAKEILLKEEEGFLTALKRALPDSQAGDDTWSWVNHVFALETLRAMPIQSLRTPCPDAAICPNFERGIDMEQEVTYGKALHAHLRQCMQTDKRLADSMSEDSKEESVSTISIDPDERWMNSIYHALIAQASRLFSDSEEKQARYVQEGIRDLEVHFKASVRGKRERQFAKLGGGVGTVCAIANATLAFLGVGVLLNIITISGSTVVLATGVSPGIWALLAISVVAAFAASFMMTRERIKSVFGAIGRYFDKASIVDSPVVFTAAVVLGALSGLGICVLAYYSGQTTFLALISVFSTAMSPVLGGVMVTFAVLCAVSTFFAGCALFIPNLYHNGQGYVEAAREKGIKGILLRLFGAEKWAETWMQKTIWAKIGLITCRVIGVGLVLFSMLSQLFLTAQSFAVMGVVLIGWVLSVLVFIATVSLTGQDVYNLVESTSKSVVRGVSLLGRALSSRFRKDNAAHQSTEHVVDSSVLEIPKPKGQECNSRVVQRQRSLSHTSLSVSVSPPVKGRETGKDSNETDHKSETEHESSQSSFTPME